MGAAGRMARGLLRCTVMDETLSLGLNGKLTRRLRLVRAAVAAARTGWAVRLAAGQFLKADLGVFPDGRVEAEAA